MLSWLKEIIEKLYAKYRTVVLYFVIGISAVLVDLVIFLFVHNVLGVEGTISNYISVGVATFYSFFLNAYKNFKKTDMMAFRITSFFAVSALGMLIGVFLIKNFTGTYGLSENWIKILSLPPIVVMQYILNKFVTFRHMKKVTEVVEEDVIEAPAAAVSRDTNKTVAVLGSGFTGLTAAYRMAKMGYDVTLYEKMPELGGLVAGATIEGQPIEKAYHFLYKTDRYIQDLLDELGIGGALKFYPSSVSAFSEGTLYPFMTPMDLLRFKPLNFIQKVRAGLVALYLGKTSRWKAFTKVSAYDWLRKWAGKRVTEVVFEPVLKGKFFDRYKDIEMSYLWSRLYVRANSKDRGDVTEKLGYFDGGWKVLVDKLASEITRLGGTIKLGQGVTGLHHQSDGRVLLHTDSESKLYDAVLSSTPSHILARLIKDNDTVDQTYLDHLDSVKYIGAATLVFSTPQELSPYYWHNVELDFPFLVILGLSALIGNERFGGNNVYYIGVYIPHDHQYFSATKEDIEAEWYTHLRRIFPHFDPSQIRQSDLYRFKNAQHIVDVGYQNKIPEYETPVQGVYLANFSQIYPDDRGTNYAVREGNKLAEMIDQYLQDTER